MYALHMNTQALLAVMGNLSDAWNEHSGRDQALMRKVLVPGRVSAGSAGCAVQMKVRCRVRVPGCRVKHSKVLVMCSSAGAVAVLVLVPWVEACGCGCRAWNCRECAVRCGVA